MAMNIFLWVVVGLVTGSTTRKLMPGPAAGGISVAILIGLMGAMVGGLVGTIFLRDAGTNHISVLTAANGALYPLFLYRCFAMRSGSPIQLPSELTVVPSLALLSAIRLPIRPSDVPGVASPKSPHGAGSALTTALVAE
jgi:uncharacterized membrane protein YeaQ/YmgE (transglycosylase-associated protein family)